MSHQFDSDLLNHNLPLLTAEGASSFSEGLRLFVNKAMLQELFMSSEPNLTKAMKAARVAPLASNLKPSPCFPFIECASHQFVMASPFFQAL